MAEPREPDRFEAKAREVWRSCLHDGDSPSHEPIANALRREHDAALDEVRQYVDASPLCSQRSMLRLLDDLASPAAAPAAETCPEPPPGWETITTGPTAGCGNIATYRDPAPAQRAEARMDGCWHGEKGHPCALPQLEAAEALLRECEDRLRVQGHTGEWAKDCKSCELRSRLAALASKPPGAGEGT